LGGQSIYSKLILKDREKSLSLFYKSKTMKLYTEEQVRKAIELSLLNAKLFIHKGLGDDKYFPTLYEALKNLTPIELPSEYEIEESSFKMSGNNVSPSSNFMIGAYWMKEKILNQNK
jgi:hypothetical protein